MELTQILIVLLLTSLVFNVIFVYNWKKAQDTIDILEKDSVQDYYLLLEYQKQIKKLNKEKEETKTKLK